jgi:hypothetical protein
MSNKKNSQKNGSNSNLNNMPTVNERLGILNFCFSNQV